MGGGHSRPGPSHHEIEEANRLRAQQEERERAAQAARQQAEMEAQRAREAEAAMRAAQAEAERIRREAEEARAAAQRREGEMREQARRAAEAAEQEARRQQQRAEEEKKRALEAQLAAEEAARKAEADTRAALEAKDEVERQLREGIQPVVMPSTADLEEAKRRIEYREGLYHFAIVGAAGSGKSSLINALRGLKSGTSGAAATGITETTLSTTRFPDPNPNNPFVWYDIPGAGTLKIPDWQYFNQQGLYVFDALIVLTDNRFTAIDVAILRNARLFNIPCYVVRSKADVHIRNVMIEMGYDSDDDEQDAKSIADLTSAARNHFIDATRESVQENLKKAALAEQRVYIVTNSTVLAVVKNNVSSKMRKRIIDENDFMKDFLSDANKRGGGGSG